MNSVCRTDASDGFDEQHGAEGIGGLDAHTEQDVVRQMALGTFYVCLVPEARSGGQDVGTSDPIGESFLERQRHR